MCWSIEVSTAVSVLEFILVVYLYYRNRENDRLLLFAFASALFVEVAEIVIWMSGPSGLPMVHMGAPGSKTNIFMLQAAQQQLQCSSLNQFGTTIAVFMVIVVQPICMTLTAYLYFQHSSDHALVHHVTKVLFGIALVCSSLEAITLGRSMLGDLDPACSWRGPHGHLMWWYPEDGFLELYMPDWAFMHLYQLTTFPAHLMCIVIRPLDDIGVVSAAFLLTYLFSYWMVSGSLEIGSFFCFTSFAVLGTAALYPYTCMRLRQARIDPSVREKVRVS